MSRYWPTLQSVDRELEINMSRSVGVLQQSPQPADVAGAPQSRAGFGWQWLLAGLLALTAATSCHAESQTGTSAAQTSLDIRVVIPAYIRVSRVTQPDQFVIENRHITQGYIDLDAATLVKITNNTRNGYLLAAQYDAEMLSKIEVKVAGKNLTASSGVGCMRVDSGVVLDKLVPISYRLHLARGVRAGGYPWPVALAFSLATECVQQIA